MGADESTSRRPSERPHGDAERPDGDAVASRGRTVLDLSRGDRAVVVSQTSLYGTSFGGPCGGAGKVDEVAAGRVVAVTATCEDANGDRWVEVAAEGGGPLGWVDPADLGATT